MKKTSLIICFLVSCVFSGICQQITQQEAVSAAVNTMRYWGITDTVINVFTKQQSDTVLLYEVRFAKGQMVLLSGCWSCKPILGYSIGNENETILNEYDQIPDGLRELIDNYARQVLSCFTSKQPGLYEEKWKKLLKNDEFKMSRETVIQPLIQTVWGQNISNDYLDSHAYNFYVLDSSPSCSYTFCPAGCVAVALAQIMKYWNYPVYNTSGTIQFDWCNMPNELNVNLYDTNNNFIEINENYEIQKKSIAALIKDCGEKVNMNYCNNNTCSSGARDYDAARALRHYGFSNANLIRRFFYSDSGWLSVIKNNLDLGRPVYYSGMGSGGHAFICDGYISDELQNGDLFHFNFGWNGAYSTYFYTLDNITPGNHNYNSWQQAIVDIYPPENADDYCNYTLSLNAFYLMYYGSLGNITPPPYENVPHTMTHLISVPNENQYPSTWRTIPSGATSEYTAHKSVVLKDGFQAEAGSEFRAYITPCEQCETTLRGNDESPKETTEEQGIMPLESVTPTSLSGQGMTIHPNPNTGKFHITLCDRQDMVKQVAVFGILGNPMVMKNNPQSEDVDISRLPSGIYVVKVLTNLGNMYFEKIVKE